MINKLSSDIWVIFKKSDGVSPLVVENKKRTLYCLKNRFSILTMTGVDILDIEIIKIKFK